MSNSGHSSTSWSNSSRCQRLTEAEREQRRIRRLFSNRESAMRSIHSSRAMHEDLIKNATQNRKLKKEKEQEQEQAVEELNHLKRKNERLKAMMEKVKKDEVNGEDGEAPPISILPFYSFFPLQMECLSQNSQNVSMSSLLQIQLQMTFFTIPKGRIGFDLNESCNDGNTNDGKVLKPSAINCFGQFSSSSTLDKKSAAREARRKRMIELQKLKSN